MPFSVVGLGEALFDVFPSGARKLGGAPLNFAVHAQQLVRGRGGRAAVVTRVGADELGDEALATLERFGTDTRFVQRDREHPTGQVLVSLTAAGQPEYTIATGAAWDQLRFTDEMVALAETCDAVCYGSLAQRTPLARETIRLFLQLAKDALRLFDVNLRQNWFDFPTLIDSCGLASAIKLNADELDRLVELFGFPREEGVRPFFEHFPIDFLILTRGEWGTTLYTGSEAVTGEPAAYAAEEQADAVGAGDACAAAVVTGLLANMPLAAVASAANRAGAFVAARAGATPELPPEITALFAP